MAPSASSYLCVRVGKQQQAAVSDVLSEVGCVAIDARPGGELRAYATSDVELDDWATRLRSTFGAELCIDKVPFDDDWKVAWARSLPPVDATPNLRIEALGSASAEPKKPGRHRLLLEPAYAFGFGEHPTTRMLIGWLESVLDPKAGSTLLDFGCGTGVLGLAALCFGARLVVGLDVSPDAIVAAQRNAELNGLGARCRFSCDALADVEHEFDVVVANVDVATLSQHCAELATRMSDRGRIGLTGFQAEQVPRVRANLAQHGVATVPIAETDGWVVVAGQKSRE